jgi:hypothetical protein
VTSTIGWVGGVVNTGDRVTIELRAASSTTAMRNPAAPQ